MWIMESEFPVGIFIFTSAFDYSLVCSFCCDKIFDVLEIYFDGNNSLVFYDLLELQAVIIFCEVHGIQEYRKYILSIWKRTRWKIQLVLHNFCSVKDSDSEMIKLLCLKLLEELVHILRVYVKFRLGCHLVTYQNGWQRWNAVYCKYCHYGFDNDFHCDRIILLF